jgi:aerobic carbon-monoxide dehydrogenase large subunit
MAEDMGGPTGHRTKRPPLAQGRVRYVGERVAVVIAATEALARYAAELVSVDYEILPAVVRAEDAVRPDAPLLHDGTANNTSFMMRMGNEGAVEAAFASELVVIAQRTSDPGRAFRMGREREP